MEGRHIDNIKFSETGEMTNVQMLQDSQLFKKLCDSINHLNLNKDSLKSFPISEITRNSNKDDWEYLIQYINIRVNLTNKQQSEKLNELLKKYINELNISTPETRNVFAELQESFLNKGVDVPDKYWKFLDAIAMHLVFNLNDNIPLNKLLSQQSPQPEKQKKSQSPALPKKSTFLFGNPFKKEKGSDSNKENKRNGKEKEKDNIKKSKF